jgi:hypothetical protein
LVHDLAAVDSVPQEVIERASVERTVAERPAGRQDTFFAADSLPIKVGPQSGNAPERQIAGEDDPDRLGLGLVSVVRVFGTASGVN